MALYFPVAWSPSQCEPVRSRYNAAAVADGPREDDPIDHALLRAIYHAASGRLPSRAELEANDPAVPGPYGDEVDRQWNATRCVGMFKELARWNCYTGDARYYDYQRWKYYYVNALAFVIDGGQIKAL